MGSPCFYAGGDSIYTFIIPLALTVSSIDLLFLLTNQCVCALSWEQTLFSVGRLEGHRRGAQLIREISMFPSPDSQNGPDLCDLRISRPDLPSSTPGLALPSRIRRDAAFHACDLTGSLVTSSHLFLDRLSSP